MQEVLRQIAGHESEPATQVFKNVKTLTNLTAGQLPRVMNVGFGRSLGVSCEHCHDASDYTSDAKPTKQVARDMWQMVQAINTQLLRPIKNLRGANPIINCTTCHRGAVKPALNLP